MTTHPPVTLLEDLLQVEDVSDPRINGPAFPLIRGALYPQYCFGPAEQVQDLGVIRRISGYL